MNLHVYLQGGIGNQMFQYAKGLSVMRQMPQFTDLVLDTSSYENQERGIVKDGLTGRTFDLEVFNITYKTQMKANPRGQTLFGYFQNVSEFENVIDEVREQFTFEIEFSKSTELLAEEINSIENSVSIHVRRGDYISNPIANQWHGVMDENYFAHAMEIMEDKHSNIHYYVFSEDIEWCENNISSKFPITFVGEEYNEYKDTGHLYLTQQCNCHIMSNSSYSWWGAFLGNSKTTIGPKNWLTNGTGSEIMLDEWIKI